MAWEMVFLSKTGKQCRNCPLGEMNFRPAEHYLPNFSSLVFTNWTGIGHRMPETGEIMAIISPHYPPTSGSGRASHGFNPVWFNSMAKQPRLEMRYTRQKPVKSRRMPLCCDLR